MEKEVRAFSISEIEEHVKWLIDNGYLPEDFEITDAQENFVLGQSPSGEARVWSRYTGFCHRICKTGEDRLEFIYNEESERYEMTSCPVVIWELSENKLEHLS